jgi:DNA repair protein RecO
MRIEGLVLAQYPFREADETVWLFTPQAGRIRVRVPGIRKAGAKHRGALQVLNCVSVRTVAGKGLPIVVDAEVSVPGPCASFEHIRIGRRLCALIMELVPADVPDAVSWQMISECMQVIRTSSAVSRDVLPVFVLRFLDIHGAFPELWRCTACGKLVTPGASVSFSRARGGVTHVHCLQDADQACARVSYETLELLSRAKEMPFVQAAVGAHAITSNATQLVEEFAEWHLGTSARLRTV